MPLTRPTVATSPPGAPAGVVTPPAATSEAVASGGSVTSWTFGAFTDPDGRIASYSATLVTVTGSGSLSGTGLGAYSITGTADGDAYTVELDALDADGGVLATAVHTVAIAAASGATTSALAFDGVDNYLSLGGAGTSPAELQLSDSDPWTVAVLARRDENYYGDRIFFGNTTSLDSYFGWSIGLKFNRPYAKFAGATGRIQAYPAQNYVVANSLWGRFFLLIATYDGAGTIKMWQPNYSTSVPADTNTGTIGTPDYSTTAVAGGTRYNTIPTINLMQGQIAQIGMWTTDQSANIADIYASGTLVDWSTLTNPPDLVHYKIESTDDPTASGGIADSSGNGLDATLENAVAGDLVTVTADKW